MVMWAQDSPHRWMNVGAQVNTDRFLLVRLCVPKRRRRKVKDQLFLKIPACSLQKFDVEQAAMRLHPYAMKLGIPVQAGCAPYDPPPMLLRSSSALMSVSCSANRYLCTGALV